ncbi:hypothetical protein [uncultured Aggregatibacter sp.]|uniref:hypothetical protein n=1 Tax=uncultured Aggregatibacter sp. TaxID=470564 RepID=UPI00280424C7|nr:hypothetical protein [uncultured Aggregatibacter sp.]
MTNKIYEIIDNTQEDSEIGEFIMRVCSPEFRIINPEDIKKFLELLGHSNKEIPRCIEIKQRKDPNKNITLIDMNIIRILNKDGDERIPTILKLLEGTVVSPILYILEASFYSEKDKFTSTIDNEYNKFILTLESYPEQSIKIDCSLSTKEFKEIFFDLLMYDNDRKYNSDYKYLCFLYDVFEKFSVPQNFGKLEVIKSAFKEMINYDFNNVDRIIAISSFIALFSNESGRHFYKVFFPRSKKDLSKNRKIKNALGDFRYLRYIIYLMPRIYNDATVRFISNDKNLFKLINSLNVTVSSYSSNLIQYKFNNVKIEDMIYPSIFKDDIYDEFLDFIESLCLNNNGNIND